MKKFNQNLMKTREILSEFLISLDEHGVEVQVWDVRNTDSDFHDFAVIVLEGLKSKAGLTKYMRAKQLMQQIDLI